jgi:hypothetical protein
MKTKNYLTAGAYLLLSTAGAAALMSCDHTDYADDVYIGGQIANLKAQVEEGSLKATSVKIVWDAAGEGAEYLCTLKSDSEVFPVYTTSNTYAKIEMDPSTAYTFTVVTADGKAVSTVNFTTLEAQGLNLRVVSDSLTATEVRLEWDAVEGDNITYDCDLSSDDDDQDFPMYTTSKNYASIEELKPNSTYKFVVTSSDGWHCSTVYFKTNERASAEE